MQEDFFIKICTSHFIARVRKVLLKFCVWEGAGDRTELKYFDPKLMTINVVSFSFFRCSTGGLGVHSAGCWLSVLHLISIFSGPQLIRAPGPFGLVWLSLPHLVSNSTATQLSATVWNCLLTSVLTVLYNSSTPTQSPTRSLKSHVWSSSSGNNCHAVHRSLSSGASVYECTMGIFLPRPISSANFRPHNFLS